MKKLALLAGVAAITVASIGSAEAQRWRGGGWHGGGWHGGWGGPRVLVGGPAYYDGYGYGGCYVRRLVRTPWGPRWRLINRCF